MRIQIIETVNPLYNPLHLNWFKETCDACSSEYGAEKLDWLHSEAINDSCDVFIQPLSSTKVKIGFVFDTNEALSANNPIHWVNITVLDTAMMDAFTQILLVTIGMNCIQSVTGSFSADWTDVRTVLSHGTIAYCTVFDWNAQQKATEQFKNALSQRQHSVDIVGYVMLLNQGLRIAQTFEKIKSLTSSKLIPTDCLTITNITSSEIIPKKNWLMLVCKN